MLLRNAENTVETIHKSMTKVGLELILGGSGTALHYFSRYLLDKGTWLEVERMAKREWAAVDSECLQHFTGFLAASQ